MIFWYQDILFWPNMHIHVAQGWVIFTIWGAWSQLEISLYSFEMRQSHGSSYWPFNPGDLWFVDQGERGGTLPPSQLPLTAFLETAKVTMATSNNVSWAALGVYGNN